MTPNTFNRLHALRVENDAARYAQQDLKPRFDRMAGRHENGTAPRAVVAYQLFQTPTALAARMAEALGAVPGQRILEPSAGLGRLLDVLPSGVDVVAVEKSAACAGELFKQDRARVTIKQRDFLTMTGADLGQFDRVIMNPPFHMRDDIKHILHALAMVKPGGRLVALCLNGHKRAETLQPLADSWEVLDAETFKEAGTKVETVLLTITKKAVV